MKIYTKIVVDISTNEVLHSESFDYSGPIAECISMGGGGESSSSKPEKVKIWTPEQEALFNALLPQLYAGLGYQLVPTGGANGTTPGAIPVGTEMPSASRGFFSINAPTFKGRGAGTSSGSYVIPTSKGTGKGGYEWVPTGESGVPRYPGNLFVPETEEEAAYLGRESNLASDLARMRAGMEATMANLSRPAYDISPETTEQYYQDVIRAPAMQEYEQIVAPQIKEAFVGPGYWGSARAEAQQAGAERLATSLSAQRANLYYADEMAKREAAESAAARAAGYAPTMAQFDYLGSMGLEEAAELTGKSRAELSRQIEQERVAGELQRWLMGETVDGVTPSQYNPYIQLVFQALGLSPYVVAANTVSSGSQFGFGIGVGS